MGDTCPICDKGILEFRINPSIVKVGLVYIKLEDGFLECTNPDCRVNNKEIQE